MARENQLFVGLDVGSTEVRCVLGNAAGDGVGFAGLQILGAASVPNTGMRKGVVVHQEEVSAAIGAALDEAERITGHAVKSVTVNANGAHLQSQISKGVVAISGSSRTISLADRERVEDAATIVQLPPNREIIQLFAKNYRIDGQANIKDPVGMQGVRLEVDALILTGSIPSLQALQTCVETSNTRINHRTVSSLASAEAVLDREAREAGSVVIDIGAGTTNLVIIDEGEIERVATIPVGSQHVTNDLAIGLKVNLKAAEKIKRDHIDLAKSQKGSKKLTVGQEEVTFALDEAAMIVEARLEELCECIDKELIQAGYSRKLPGGVFLTGGGARLAGLTNVFRQQLDLPVRLGQVQGLSGLTDSVGKPEYATATGLMILDMLLGDTADTHVQGVKLDSMVSRLKKLIGKSA